MTESTIRIGCAGWTIPADAAADFPAGETHLQRYASRFTAVEINTTFNKAHRRKTYKSWAASVPAHFRFAVKLPKQVTHISRLADLAAVGYFLPDVCSLGDKLGPLLMQLPPSLSFDASLVGRFLDYLRAHFAGSVVCEPRHASWFVPEADRLLASFRVARVAADPAPVPTNGHPGGWPGLVYYRLHGSPRIYYSPYSNSYLDTLALSLTEAARTAEVWCIFDNTASGAAVGNALHLLDQLKQQ